MPNEDSFTVNVCGTEIRMVRRKSETEKYYYIRTEGQIYDHVATTDKTYSEEEFAERGLAISLILNRLYENEVSLADEDGDADLDWLPDDVFYFIPSDSESGINPEYLYFFEITYITPDGEYRVMLDDIPVEEQQEIIQEYLEREDRAVDVDELFEKMYY